MNENTETKITKDVLIKMLASRGQFTYGDAKIFLDTLIGILEDVVLHKWEFSVPTLGVIKYASFKARTKLIPIPGSNGKVEEKKVSPGERIHFSLSKNITKMAKIRLRLGEEQEME